MLANKPKLTRHLIPDEPSDDEIFTVAWKMLEEHGGMAALDVAQRADACLDAGDMDGKRMWIRVLQAIEAILETGRKGDVH